MGSRGWDLTRRPEWVKPFPVEWMARLRDISPVSAVTTYLWPRWRETESEWWLYEAVPIALMTNDRREQLARHWSELPKDQQYARKRYVSEYQFWMFHTHQVDARPFWVLQGTKFITGGTPYSYTEREQRLLEANGEETEPIPPGTLPNVPFDERVVQAILARDRLLKVGGDLDRLLKENRPEHLRAADAEAEREYRKAFLKWNHQQNQPMSEFMKWYRTTEQGKRTLSDGRPIQTSGTAHWRDNYIEHGYVQTGTAKSRRVLVPVR